MRHFSIRDLLWLTLAVGLAVGWWVNRRELGEQSAIQLHRSDLLEWRLSQWEQAYGELPERNGNTGLPQDVVDLYRIIGTTDEKPSNPN